MPQSCNNAIILPTAGRDIEYSRLCQAGGTTAKAITPDAGLKSNERHRLVHSLRDTRADVIHNHPQLTDPTTTPPVIQINGANPAVIQIGANYSDLGVRITGPQANLNLSLATYLNGVAMSPIVVNAGTPATDTIAYVVTDQNGLTSTSTRAVIIEPAATAPPPASVATSSAATSTSQ